MRSIWNTAITKMNGNFKFHRTDYGTQKEFREELKANGYQVIKMFNGYMSDEYCDEWLFENRKDY